MRRTTSILDMRWILIILGFVAGLISLLAIRAAAYDPPQETHYHANFAVYINGQREQFKALDYYEEEAASNCSVATAEEAETSPMSRVHMHGNINDVVHVEDSRVTWGNFFTVLKWNIGSTYIATRDGMYQNNGTAKVTFMLNGKSVDDVANATIQDQDKLLVNYGDQTASQITGEYNLIKNNALKADQSKDPAGCGGGHTDTASMRERMKHMF